MHNSHSGFCLLHLTDKMSVLQQVLTDARKLATRLRDHDSSAESLLSQAQGMFKQVESMKEVSTVQYSTCKLWFGFGKDASFPISRCDQPSPENAIWEVDTWCFSSMKIVRVTLIWYCIICCMEKKLVFDRCWPGSLETALKSIIKHVCHERDW